MLNKNKLALTSNQTVFLLVVYCLVVLNLGFWNHFFSIQQEAGYNWLLIATMPIFLEAAMNLVLHLLFYHYFNLVFFPIVLVLGSGAAYAVMTQGIYFNADQIVNILHTDPGEASAWISSKFVVWVVCTGVLPALLYVLGFRLKPAASVRWKNVGWRLVSMLGSLVVIGAIAGVAYQSYASFFRNHKAIVHKIVPSSYLGGIVQVGLNHYEASRPLERIGLDASRKVAQGAQKNVLIFVVGETTRAQNWGLNPNAPQTTPQLAAMPEVINYPEVVSCGTSTAVSVPCMFSKMGHADYNERVARHQEGLLDILQRAGLYVSWKDNDGGCKGVCDRVKNMRIIETANPKECKDGLCYDRTLLEHLQEEIASMPQDGVIVLHTVGSHGPAYYERYPQEFRKFTPTCDTNQLQDCDAERLQNTYNNTILSVDDTLVRTIRLLQASQVNAAVWYVSDHGESLGEKGMYLHGAPYVVAPAEQTHVPMVFWANTGFYQAKGLNYQCLKERSSKLHSHDHVFSSILGLMDVSTSEYRQDREMFAACRG